MQSRKIKPALVRDSGVAGVSADQIKNMNNVGIEALMQKSLPIPILIKGVIMNNIPAAYQLRLALYLPFKIHHRINPSKSKKITTITALMGVMWNADVSEACGLTRKYAKEIPRMIPPPRTFSNENREPMSFAIREKKSRKFYTFNPLVKFSGSITSFGTFRTT